MVKFLIGRGGVIHLWGRIVQREKRKENRIMVWSKRSNSCWRSWKCCCWWQKFISSKYFKTREKRRNSSQAGKTVLWLVLLFKNVLFYFLLGNKKFMIIENNFSCIFLSISFLFSCIRFAIILILSISKMQKNLKRGCIPNCMSQSCTSSSFSSCIFFNLFFIHYIKDPHTLLEVKRPLHNYKNWFTS